MYTPDPETQAEMVRQIDLANSAIDKTRSAVPDVRCAGHGGECSCWKTNLFRAIVVMEEILLAADRHDFATAYHIASTVQRLNEAVMVSMAIRLPKEHEEWMRNWVAANIREDVRQEVLRSILGTPSPN